MNFLIVFLGAGIGGMARHGVNMVAMRTVGFGFPYGTLAINVVGSTAMGALAAYFAYRGEATQAWRLFLTTGILGGFTTFSAFSLETALLYERGAVGSAMAYVAASVALALLGVFAGLAAVRFGLR